MFGRRSRLAAAHKLLAVKVAREKFELAAGNKIEFERLVRSDRRVKSIDPALLALFIQVPLAVFEYMRNRKASGLSYAEQDDQTLFLNSIPFGA